MSAQAKTKNLLRADVPLSLLVENENNPNKMTEKEFDLLVQNIEEEGCTEPVYCAPMDLEYFAELVKLIGGASDVTEEDVFHTMEQDGQKFRITAGHHRAEACRYLGMETVPCTINWDAAFDKEKQDVQLVRHNVIKGKMDPLKFYTLYKKYEATHGKEMMAEMFGFADRAELDALIRQTEKALPADLKEKFKEAAEEIKTVDDLAKLLNRLFSTYGDTLPFGYMLIDFGGKDSIWLRMTKPTHSAMLLLGERCKAENRTMDDLVGSVVQLMAKGEADQFLDKAVLQAPATPVPEDLKVLPTKDNLKKLESVG